MKLFLSVLILLTGLGWFSVQGQESGCATPERLRVERESASVLWLQWGGSANQYEISYTSDGGQTNTTFVISGNRHAIVGYQNDRIYNVSLRSICADGTKSDFVHLRHGNYSPCETPVTLNHHSVNAQTVALKWKWSPNVSFYTVEYRVKGSTNIIASIQTPRNEVVLSRLRPDTEYQFQVMSVCNNNTVSIPAIYYFTTAPSITCVTPSGVTARGYDLNSIVVGWDHVPGAVAYEVRRQLNTTNTWVTSQTWNNSLIASGLMQGLSYRFQVRAVCNMDGSNVSEWSPVYFAQTLPPTYPVQNCLNPTQVRVQITSGTSATLLWNGSAEASGYEILSSTDGQNYSLYATSTTSKLNLNDLMPIRYWVKVRSVCGVNRSTESKPLLFRMGLWGRETTDQQLENTAFSVYPNPAHDQLSLTWHQETTNATFNIVDLNGRTVLTREISLVNGVNSLNLDNLNAGIYSLQVQTSEGVSQQKLVIE